MWYNKLPMYFYPKIIIGGAYHMSTLENITIKDLFEFDYTLAKDLLNQKKYPWEVLPRIGEYIFALGPTLSKKEYSLCRGVDGKENIWISKTAKIAKDANLYGPLIVGPGTEIRHNAFIRGKVIIGKNCVIGNSTEIKNSILLNNVQVPHYNYVGDSILGNHAHLGAGAIISNLKSTKTEVYIGREHATGLRKVGAFLGDHVEVGCNSVLNPGTVIGTNTIIYPVSCVMGVIPSDCIVKTELNITKRSKNR